jgi:hypothetical protein
MALGRNTFLKDLRASTGPIPTVTISWEKVVPQCGGHIKWSVHGQSYED